MLLKQCLGVLMTDMNELQKRLEVLKREHRGIRSWIEMMERGTPREELQRLRVEYLKTIEEEITRMEIELAKTSGDT
jgi:hypothetical protein